MRCATKSRIAMCLNTPVSVNKRCRSERAFEPVQRMRFFAFSLGRGPTLADVGLDITLTCVGTRALLRYVRPTLASLNRGPTSTDIDLPHKSAFYITVLRARYHILCHIFTNLNRRTHRNAQHLSLAEEDRTVAPVDGTSDTHWPNSAAYFSKNIQ